MLLTVIILQYRQVSNHYVVYLKLKCYISTMYFNPRQKHQVKTRQKKVQRPTEGMLLESVMCVLCPPPPLPTE